MTIAWGITGSGHYLAESITLLQEFTQVDLFLSRAAEEVLTIYHYNLKNLIPAQDVYKDRASSSPVIGRLYHQHYDLLVIAPATSNSVAKFVHGISDSLITNLFAQAGKCRVPTIVLPSDTATDIVSPGPIGPVQVFPRPVDLDNTQRLATFPGVTVVKNPKELQQCLAASL